MDVLGRHSLYAAVVLAHAKVQRVSILQQFKLGKQMWFRVAVCVQTRPTMKISMRNQGTQHTFKCAQMSCWFLTTMAHKEMVLKKEAIYVVFIDNVLDQGCPASKQAGTTCPMDCTSRGHTTHRCIACMAPCSQHPPPKPHCTACPSAHLHGITCLGTPLHCKLPSCGFPCCIVTLGQLGHRFSHPEA